MHTRCTHDAHTMHTMHTRCTHDAHTMRTRCAHDAHAKNAAHTMHTRHIMHTVTTHELVTMHIIHWATRPGGGQSEIYFLTFLELVSRIRNEGPWVWLDYRHDRCPFSTHIVAPCFLTFSHRVRFKTFEGGFDAPRFLSSELFVGIRVDRVRS